eukprot:gene6243-6962_t
MSSVNNSSAVFSKLISEGENGEGNSEEEQIEIAEAKERIGRKDSIFLYNMDGDVIEVSKADYNDETQDGSGFFSGMRKSAAKLGSSFKHKTAKARIQKKSFQRIGENTLKYARKWKVLRHAKKESDIVYKSDRNVPKHGTSQYRRGPIPLESLPSSDGYVSRPSHGSLDSDDEDARRSSPSSQGLLVYFRTLAESADENERVDLKFVDSLLKAGADINHTDRYGQTALHAISRDWHVDVVKFALEHGANINKADSFGRTPLHLASAIDYHEMVEYLVLNGAMIDAKTSDGQTPMHFACKNSAVNSIKALMKLGAKINERDNDLRTPLFVAAESAGVYDIHGNSAMVLMVEKMPTVALEALGQFYVDDRALKRKYYYLNQLEAEVNKKEKGKDFAKTVLEMIVIYKETDLVMHPVIQKMISVKWNLFARKKSLIDLFVNLFYTIIIFVLALLVPRDGKPYTPLEKKAWRIVLEVIFFGLTIYFVIKAIRTSIKLRNKDLEWRDWTVRNLENQLEHCHPKWPDERKYIENEIERTWKFSGTYSRDLFWDIYELLLLLSTTVMILCLRLMRICRAFNFLSVFIVLLGHVVGATVKFAFLFFEFFIPYVCMIWLIFGGPVVAAEIEKASGADKAKQFRTFDEILFLAWRMTVTADIPFGAMVNYHRDLASLIVGSYYALVSVVCINIYIALMSELFTRVYENAEANASLEQALLIISLECQMNNRTLQKTKRYFQSRCSPLEDVQYGKTKGGSLKPALEMNSVLDNLNRDLIAATELLEESKSVKDNSDSSEAILLDDLSKTSELLLCNQQGLVDQMKLSYEDVLKTQEGLTRSLHGVVKKTLRNDKKVHPTLRRSRSSNSLGF